MLQHFLLFPQQFQKPSPLGLQSCVIELTDYLLQRTFSSRRSLLNRTLKLWKKGGGYFWYDFEIRNYFWKHFWIRKLLWNRQSFENDFKIGNYFWKDFKNLVLQTCKNKGLFGKELTTVWALFLFPQWVQKYFNPSPNKLWFLRVWSLLKTLWEKEKLLVTSNFSFSHSVFYWFEKLPTIFINFEIVVCKLFQFGRV